MNSKLEFWLAFRQREMIAEVSSTHSKAGRALSAGESRQQEELIRKMST
jgi:hypothetical protein